MQLLVNPVKPSVAFKIETSHLICSANQNTGFCMKYMTVFHMKCSTGLKRVKEISWISCFVDNLRSTAKISQSKSCTNSHTNKAASSSWISDGFSSSSSPNCPVNTQKKGILNFSQTRNDDEAKSRPSTFTRHDFRDMSDPNKCKLFFSKLVLVIMEKQLEEATQEEIRCLPLKIFQLWCF